MTLARLTRTLGAALARAASRKRPADRRADRRMQPPDRRTASTAYPPSPHHAHLDGGDAYEHTPARVVINTAAATAHADTAGTPVTEAATTAEAADTAKKAQNAPENAADAPAGIDLATDADELLRLARAACADSAYTAADSLLREASAFLALNSAPDDSGGEWPLLPKYVADVISIYTDLLPPGFHVPEELSSIIFSRRLLQSLIQKSSGVTAQDSAALARLAARRGVSYDFPVVWTDRVKTALLFFLKRRDALFDRWYARADHYIPPMKRMFVEAGLPGDLAYLPILESGFDPNAYSSAHAAGIWQFIPSTGRQYGLRQNYWLDERRDPLKATAAAIAYLDKLYGDFKNWHTALAAYNCGETRMGRAVMKAGTTKDFWALSLPDETMDYIPFFIAALVIAKNHDILELGFAEGEPFDPDTVSVRDCIDLAAAAEALGANADSLAALNPHILRGRTPPDMDGIRLYLPKGSAAKFKEWYDTIPDDRKTKFYRYSTKPGDNVASIAAAFNVSQDSLRKWNGIKPKTAAAGENVIVALPVNDTVPSALALRLNVSDWDTPGKIPNFGGTEFAELQSRGHGDGLTLRTGKKTTYKVRAGETLQAVADSFNVSVKELLAWNYMANPRALKAEHTLVVYLPPDSAAAAQDPEDSAAATSAKYTLKRVVKPGETFFGIAVELGVPVIELAEINGLNPKRPLIAPGYTLRYAPKPAPKPQAAAATATAAAEPAHKQHTGANKKAVRAPENAAADSAAVKFALYVVKPTDSIWRIAKNFGISADSLRETNNINDKSKVFPGDTLKIAAQPRKNTESGKDGK